MKDKITVIITIRNRDSWRIEDQVNSIRATGANPSFHVVDYGSDEPFAIAYKTLCEKLNVKYTHMYSEGLPWNKCRALNYGAKAATTPFIVTSDVDMIYETNVFQWCLDHYEDKTLFNVPTYWLSENGNKQKAKAAGKGNPGGFDFTSKEAFIDINGYDERYQYWGLEDLDWVTRLTKVGYKQIWLPDEYKIYHQWHVKSEKGNLRPFNVTIDSNVFFLENYIRPVLDIQNWGNNLTKEERPILNYIKNQKPAEYTVQFSKFQDHLVRIYNLGQKEHFIKVNLLQRYSKKPLSFLQSFIQICFKPLGYLTGLKCSPKLNSNFDFFYSFIPTFPKLGLIDYYISSNVESVYLLWKEN